MPKITLVKKPPKLEQKKRVAAYARVSTGKDAMLHSLSSQVSYYSDFIQKHDGWLYVGVYADEAQSGTKDSRDDFQRLLDDCRAGKIDMVITKSISRFARNTVTLLQTVRDLKALGVDVFFEEQNIYTMSADGELLITILASYAQEESRSASENQKWRIKKNFEAGLPWNGAMLGYRLNDGNFSILEEEADIVRRIFREYLEGKGYQAIASGLNKDGVETRFNRIWHHTVISAVLSNYSYTGNLLLQKTYRENHLTKKKMFNKGDLPQYHVENAHEAIIDLETYNKVQAEKKRRASRFGKQYDHQKRYMFSSLISCENCGRHYRRKVITTDIVWICPTYNQRGKAECSSKQIPDGALMQATAMVLGGGFTEAQLRKTIKSIVACNGNKLIYKFYDGTEVTQTWKDRSRSNSWTDEMREAARQRAKERRRK